LSVEPDQASGSEDCPFRLPGITLERARRILQAMQVDVQTAVLSLNGGTGKTGSSRVSA
jgi:hypothetical protein